MFNPFNKQAQKVITDALEWSKVVYADLDADLSDIKFTAGNVGAHGKCVAHAASGPALVTYTVGNRFSPVFMQSDGLGPSSSLWGVTVHEVAHVMLGRAKNPPIGPTIKDSTHRNAEWLWVVARGWSQYHGVEVTPIMIRFAATGDKFDTDVLSRWQPDHPIPAGILEQTFCETCRTPFQPQRKTARFCSTKCRVAAHRSAKQ